MVSGQEDTLQATDATIDAGVGGPGSAPEVTGGTTIGRFEVVERLGAGGNGIVYAARDPKLGRRVALKLLLPGRGQSERLIREAQAMAALSHPNVASVFEIGEHDGRVFIAMELIDGQTLREWQRDRTVREILAAYRQAGQGLAAAHAVGLVHRDFKPDNVMVGSDGRPRVLDFGLARPSGVPLLEVASTGHDLTHAATLTETGAIVGTPAYMAPEQFAGAEATAGTDQFAFCVALYEALFGSRPFEAETLPALAARVLEGQLERPPDRKGVLRRVREAIVRGLAAKSDDRFESMEALLQRLRPQPRRRWAAGFGIVGMTSIAAVALWGSRERVPELCRRRPPIEQVRPALGKDKLEPLDRYASQWLAAREAVCDAPRPADDTERQRQAAARVCLEHHLELRQATIARLHDVDEETSDELVRQLPPPRRCATSMVPVFSDADVDAAVDVRVQLAKAWVHGRRSEPAEAVRAGAVAVEMARKLPSPILEAQALLGLYWAQWRAGKFAESLETVEAAVVAAQRGGDEYIAVIAKAIAAPTAAQLSTADVAERWAAQAEASAERIPDDPEVEAWIAFARGTMAIVAGRPADGVSPLEHAVDDFATALGDDAFEVIIALNNLGNAREHSGDLVGARRAHSRQLEIVQARFGPDSADLRYPLLALSRLELAAGSLDEAEVLAQRALRLVERVVPRGSAEHMATHQGVARVLEARSMWQRAVTHRRAALEEARAVFGDDSEVTALRLHELGIALLQTRSGEAVDVISQAVATMQSILSGNELRDSTAYGKMLADLEEARSAQQGSLRAGNDP